MSDDRSPPAESLDRPERDAAGGECSIDFRPRSKADDDDAPRYLGIRRAAGRDYHVIYLGLSAPGADGSSGKRYRYQPVTKPRTDEAAG